MSKTFITDLHIEKVRHIENFDIPLSKSEMKYLIITGKNGSGKTSVLNEIKATLNYLIQKQYSHIIRNRLALKNTEGLTELKSLNESLLAMSPYNLTLEYSEDLSLIEIAASSKNYAIVFFEARRAPTLKAPKGVEKIDFNFNESVTPSAGSQFIQFMVNRFFEQLVAYKDKDNQKVDLVESWFGKIQNAFRDLLDDQTAVIQFDDKDYNFNIIQNGRAKYNLTQLSDGYASVISLVSELIMRMEAQNISSYEAEGVALIDEIETHLHVDLQKKILPFLTAFFPNIQFIVTTHSPFVINSVKNAVICDLEKRIVTEDLSGYSYGTLIESYFGSDNYSEELKKDLAEYEALMKSKELSLEEEEKLQDLEIKLNQLPKYWAPELDYKLKQIQLEKADRAPA